MKRFLLSLSLALLPAGVFALPVYTYKARCWVDTPSPEIEDLCTIVETRTASGGLQTRNIYSNRFSLTVKSWFDPNKGFMTWDSSSQTEYQWSYQIGPVRNGIADSYVMPGFRVENLPWD